MEKVSLSKRVVLFLMYINFIPALITLIFEKDLDREIKFHIIQSLFLAVLGCVTCGIGDIIALVFAIIALIKGTAPKLPLVGDWLESLANK